ncbi:MAG TPA: DUF58 domain-containing protein [Chitinophagaceae bacterium]|nr:DUF58 domain-containing protein [Chitinophagaceae bacterium]
MSRLLDPKILMSIKNLQLSARATVDGFMAGINKSKVKGPGLEFSQYRSYQPGDDLRWLDWKMYARSDRYYIRESEIETSISVRLLIDASASMNHSDEGVTKIEYAKYLAASLAYLAHMQNDSVGLYVLQDNRLFMLPSKKDHQHLSRLYYQIEQIKPGGKFTAPLQYKDIFAGTTKKELLIFITDLYQEQDEIFQLADALAAYKHEIILFHIMSQNEMELDYKGYKALEDLETGEVVNVDTGRDKETYQQNLRDYLASIRRELLNRNIFYRMMNTSQPLDQVLKDFLNQRNKLKA